MKKVFVLICLLVVFTTSYAYADEDPVLVEVTNMLQEILDFSNRKIVSYNDMGGVVDRNHFDITFDGRKGNEDVQILCYYTERAFTVYPVNSLERTHCLLYCLNHFEDIRDMLPPTVEFSIFTRENDGSKLYITEDNYQDYLNLYRDALGISK